MKPKMSTFKRTHAVSPAAPMSARDETNVRDLRCVFDAKVEPRWTPEGWRFSVTLP